MYLKSQEDFFKLYKYKSISSFKLYVFVTFTMYSYESFRYKIDIIVHVSRPAGVDLT